MSFKCFQRFGPDSIFFRVTGVPESLQLNKGDPNEEFDIIVNYDVLNSDPEVIEQKIEAFKNLTQLDSSGRININSLLEVAAASIDPILSDNILQPAEQAQEQVMKDVTDDLAKIYAGIEMPARPNGGQTALQMIQQYTAQPDVGQRAQTDQAFAARLQKYAGQYTFQMQQMQNAQIGRIGTNPAEMGEVQTQEMPQQ